MMAHLRGFDETLDPNHDLRFLSWRCDRALIDQIEQSIESRHFNHSLPNDIFPPALDELRMESARHFSRCNLNASKREQSLRIFRATSW
jgi:hypothetical protein